MRERPLSPHLSVYRFKYTMALSILHRITGVWLSVGLVRAGLLAGERWRPARRAYARAQRLARQLVGPGCCCSAWLAAFCYHFVNGLRHLAWDAGFGLRARQARRSARAWSWSRSLLALLLVGYLLFCPRAGAP